jgi:antitoxin ParD1/3/4/toxin ParE1/3/4
MSDKEVSYRLSSKAEEDLFAIWSYIARDSVEAADRVEAAIHGACEFLAASPSSGHARKDLTKLRVHFWTVVRYRNYVIVFDPETSPLQIIRIFHGARNISRELSKPE